LKVRLLEYELLVFAFEDQELFMQTLGLQSAFIVQLSLFFSFQQSQF
jgi:hypothetical protein